MFKLRRKSQCSIFGSTQSYVGVYFSYLAKMEDLPERLGSIELFFAHGKQCHRFRVGSDTLLEIDEISELQSDHEEADTRILLHAKHASHDYDHVVIRSPDTDVFVLLVGHKCSFDASLNFETGSGNKCRIIDINKIQEELGSDFSSALLGFHSFTGITNQDTSFFNCDNYN